MSTLFEYNADDIRILLVFRYEILDEFFNSLQSSIRILGLKGSMSTFTSISRAVESLTDRYTNSFIQNA